MAPIRTHLYFSTFWSVRRPKFPLTEGHFVLRLNDPAIAFGTASAADLLHCYGRLRRILAAVKGATAAQLYMALNWQPVGDSVGEPLAETSTPTLHVFFHWPGSPAAATALALPAHRRVAAVGTEVLDGEIRDWNGGTCSDGSAERPAPGREPRQAALHDSMPGGKQPWEQESGAEPPFSIEPVGTPLGEPFRCGHWTAVPRSPTATLDQLDPAALTLLANTIQGLASAPSPAFQGMSAWTTDGWKSTAPATLHIFARQHGDAPQLLAEFVAAGGLDLP